MPDTENIDINLHSNSYEKYNLYINKKQSFIPTPSPTPIPPTIFTTVNSITSTGSLPKLTTNNPDGNITVEFNEGSLPSYEPITVRKI